MVRALRTCVVPLACVALGAVPAMASAGPPSVSNARVVAKRAAASMAKQTHASSWRISSCHRARSSTNCSVVMGYRTGASRCTVDVIVTRKPGTGRLTWRPSQYHCF
jgi:hypothetical protein